MVLKATYQIATSPIDVDKLAHGLPGFVQSRQSMDPIDGDIIELTGYDAFGRAKFDCKFSFNQQAGVRASKIKNFSIHDPCERGCGLGAKVIANLLDVTRDHRNLERISLTAELERGAYVWAKMGWLPYQASFAKLQRSCQPKLDVLQQLIPSQNRLAPAIYGIFRDLLDAETSKDPKFIWAMTDSNAAYDVISLKNLQGVAQIEDTAKRRQEIQQRATINGIRYTDATLAQADKDLRFIKNIDLDGLARDGKIPVAVLLFAWEQWKGDLDLNNVDQVSPNQRGQAEAALIKKGYSLQQIREFLEGSTKPEQDLGLDKK